jgi:hypothetical protein
MFSRSRFSLALAFLLCIFPATYHSCLAQSQQVNIITHAITASSCTIGIAEINSGTLTSCTVQVTLTSSMGAFPASVITTRATLTMQSPRTTFSWSAGAIARVEVVAITPTTSPAWCDGGWASPYFVSNPFSPLQAEITDSRVDARVTTTLLEPLLQDSLTYVINASSVVLLPTAPSPLRLAVAFDTVLTVLSRQGFVLRDAWVRDFHLGVCQSESPTFPTSIYALIRLQRLSADFFSALMATWIANARMPARITSGLGSTDRTRIGEILSSTNQFSRYYNFARALSVGSATQPERLQVQIAPQPVEGNTTMTITTPSPMTADVRLVNMLGQIVAVLAQGQRLSAGTTTLPIASAGLASGVYAVQVVSNGRILHTQSVVVAR